jgi:hypothetical protein
LTRLGLHGNELAGSIPSELGRLKNLQELWLGGNALAEMIPAELSNLSNLQYLDLSWNQLAGTIPSELGKLARLRYLFLDNNQVNGEIPASFFALANLDDSLGLFLSHNQLQCSDPVLLAYLNTKHSGTPGEWVSEQRGGQIDSNLAGGAASSITAGAGESIRSGYAVLTVKSGTAPYGTAVVSLKQNGVTISEVGVPASPPTTSARIFIDYRSTVRAVPGRADSGDIDINTGIAIVNHGSADVHITYTLRDMAGATLATGHGTLAAGCHRALFIDQLTDSAPDFALPPDFQSSIQFASLEISGDQPLSIFALRLSVNQRSEALLTTAPIADRTQPLAGSPIYFPQFVDGGGYSSSLILMNTSTSTETGILLFRDDDGAPLAVNQAGGTSSHSFRYSIPSGGTFRFQTDGSVDDLKAGWVQLIPDARTSTPTGWGVFSYNPRSVLVTEAGFPAVVATTHARIYVDLSENHNTGLAIANVTESNASITIKAFQSDGTISVGTSAGQLGLVGRGHGAKFATEFVPGLPSGFTGVLDISSPTPFAAFTMRSLYNERNELLMTTFPVADAIETPRSPLTVPVRDGGGYVTQFILLSPSSASTSTLGLYSQAGAPMAVGWK